MGTDDRSTQSKTTLAVVGMLSIPLISVSTAVFAADVATAADQASLGPVLLATIAGALAGVCSWHLVSRAVECFALVTSILVDRESTTASWWRPAPEFRFAPAAIVVPLGWLRRSPLQRRGPPVGLI